jgi:hypothetical protein
LLATYTASSWRFDPVTVMICFEAWQLWYYPIYN